MLITPKNKYGEVFDMYKISDLVWYVEVTDAFLPLNPPSSIVFWDTNLDENEISGDIVIEGP